jgi:hypothetical protein
MREQTCVPVRWYSQIREEPAQLTDADVRGLVQKPVVQLLPKANTKVFMLDSRGNPAQLREAEPLPIGTVYFCQLSRRFVAAILNQSLLLVRGSLVQCINSPNLLLQQQTYLCVIVASKCR